MMIHIQQKTMEKSTLTPTQMTQITKMGESELKASDMLKERWPAKMMSEKIEKPDDIVKQTPNLEFNKHHYPTLMQTRMEILIIQTHNQLKEMEGKGSNPMLNCIKPFAINSPDFMNLMPGDADFNPNDIVSMQKRHIMQQQEMMIHQQQMMYYQREIMEKSTLTPTQMTQITKMGESERRASDQTK